MTVPGALRPPIWHLATMEMSYLWIWVENRFTYLTSMIRVVRKPFSVHRGNIQVIHHCVVASREEKLLSRVSSLISSLSLNRIGWARSKIWWLCETEWCRRYGGFCRQKCKNIATACRRSKTPSKSTELYLMRAFFSVVHFAIAPFKYSKRVNEKRIKREG